MRLPETGELPTGRRAGKGTITFQQEISQSPKSTIWLSLSRMRLRVDSGVRYDDFEADAVADGPYVSGNPGLPAPQDFEDSEVTASLGVVYFIDDSVSL